MPWWVSESWLKERGCTDRDFGDVPIPFVWMPHRNEPPMFDLAAYGEIDGEPGHHKVQWFSWRGHRFPRPSRVQLNHGRTSAAAITGLVFGEGQRR